MTPQIFAWPPSLRILIEAVNRVFQLILLLPAQASTVAESVDWLQYFELSIYTLISILYFAAAIYFILRFRRRSEHENTPEVTNHGIVIAWSIAVFAIFVVFWFIGYVQYRHMRTPPDDAIDVYVTAKQWTWKFAYTEQGGASVGVLYVPVNRPIRLLLTSRDVIHSFFVPTFRLKQDAVPGTYTTLWFQVTRPGTYQILCAQMCGVGHQRMWGQIVALDGPDYERWRRGQTPEVARAAVGLTENLPGESGPPTPVTPTEQGRRAAETFACLKCHTIDGQPHIGPTWLGLYGSQELLADGTHARVDEAYITRSIMDPTADIVAGFQPVMPSYQGLVGPSDVAAIIEYLKSLRDIGQPHVVAPLPAGRVNGLAAHPRGANVPPPGERP